MTEGQAFLVQARSDFAVFKLLLDQDRSEIPGCHALHYFQMATEKAAKAAILASGQATRYSHVAFSKLRLVLSRRDVARSLGWVQFDAFTAFLRRTAPIFNEIDQLHPSVGPSTGKGEPVGPNVEYPWAVLSNWHAPATHTFKILDRLQRSGNAAQVLKFIQTLLERFETVFSS